MRLLTLALPLAAALVLAVPATAARPPATTGFGTPAFTSTPSADSIHRDVTLTVPFTHTGTVGIVSTITVNGAVQGPFETEVFRGHGSDTYTWLITGADGCFPPLPGDKVSYHLQLVELRFSHRTWHEGAVLAEITTDTFTIT